VTILAEPSEERLMVWHHDDTTPQSSPGKDNFDKVITDRLSVTDMHHASARAMVCNKSCRDSCTNLWSCQARFLPPFPPPPVDGRSGRRVSGLKSVHLPSTGYPESTTVETDATLKLCRTRFFGNHFCVVYAHCGSSGAGKHMSQFGQNGRSRI
jgi:hypothetical protein